MDVVHDDRLPLGMKLQLPEIGSNEGESDIASAEYDVHDGAVEPSQY